MCRLRVVFLVLCGFVYTVQGQRFFVPPSPCPNVFTYRQDEEGWYGAITIHVPSYEMEVFLEVTLSLDSTLPTTGYMQDIVLPGSEEDILRRVQDGMPITYVVNFPSRSPFPRVKRIYVNGRQVCHGYPERFGASSVMDVTLSSSHSFYRNGDGRTRDYRSSYNSPNGAFSQNYSFMSAHREQPYRPSWIGGSQNDNFDSNLRRHQEIIRRNEEYANYLSNMRNREFDLRLNKDSFDRTDTPYYSDGIEEDRFVQNNVKSTDYENDRVYNDSNIGELINHYIRNNRVNRPITRTQPQDISTDPTDLDYDTNTTPPDYSEEMAGDSQYGWYNTTPSKYESNRSETNTTLGGYNNSRLNMTRTMAHERNKNHWSSPPAQPQIQSSSQSNIRTSSQPNIRTSSQAPPLPSSTESLSYDCGIPATINTLVVNGQKTSKGLWPWMVAIYIRRPEHLKFHCGATLVSNRHIVTVGHCMTDPQTNKPLTVKNVLIKLGVFNIQDWSDEDTKQTTVNKIVMHPEYNKDTLTNDIAVLTLATPVEFSQYIIPACLWDSDADSNLITGQIGAFIGWGKEEIGNTKWHSELRVINMPVISTETCRANSENHQTLDNSNTLCAGARDGSGPCNGDSGTGVYLYIDGKWFVRGIVSMVPMHANRTCNLREYFVLTDVAKFVPWIQTFID